MIQEKRNCQNCKNEFVIEPEDFDFYKKIEVPAPTFCPECRLQRRMLWHNERYLFRVKSEKSGKEIFSMYPPQPNLTIWERAEWNADDWDQNKTGLDYDWNKPFFLQFKKLLAKAPVPSRGIVQLVNSDYSNNASYLKDCYLVFGSAYIENGAYLENCVRTKDSMDVSLVSDSELSYECFFNVRCYQSLYSSYCEDSHDIQFCRSCSACSYCFGCIGLRGKSYYIFNKPYSKEEYEKQVESFGVHSYKKREDIKKRVNEFWEKYPVRYARNYKNVNSSGEYITNSKNVTKSYQVDGGENLKYCHSVYVKPGKDSYDQYRYGDNSELMYDAALVGGHSAGIRFSYHIYTDCREVEYSWNCNRVSSLFGCVGLHGKQNCILNKQYSEHEYREMVKKIKKHMNEVPYVDGNGRVYTYGEFFPPFLAPVSYNQSVAMEYFPLSHEEVLAYGGTWGDVQRKEYAATILSEDIPDTIAEIPDSICLEIIECAHKGICDHECTKVIRIIPQELHLYRKLNVSLPHFCPNCRFFERIRQRSPVKSYRRTCQCAGSYSENGTYKNVAKHFHKEKKCSNEFETTYMPEQPEIVYCESCYQQEVI